MRSPNTECSKLASHPSSPSAPKEHLKTLKHELKEWESRFQLENGRAPNKSDLLAHPEVAHKYKKYSKLKRERTSNADPDGSSERLKGSHKHAVKENEEEDNDTEQHRQISLPLQTSRLSVSHKRPWTKQQSSTKQAAAHHDSPTIKREHDGPGESSDDECIEATPKRRRIESRCSIAGPFTDVLPKTEPRPLQGRRLFSAVVENKPRSPNPNRRILNGSAINSPLPLTDDDAPVYQPKWDYNAMYTPPPPSLLTRARTVAGTFHTIVPQNNTPTRAPASSMNDTLSTSHMLDLNPTMPSFQARAGRLVKTTSISLKEFGARFGGVSQILDSQQDVGYSDSDGDRDKDGLGDGLEDLALEDLVVENDENGPDYGNNDVQKKKKGTQKRSTRRVKLRPVDPNSSSGLGSTKRRTGLVSENFYKLKLRKKGNHRSVEGRRTELYKRMVASKSRKNSNKDKAVHQTNDSSETMVMKGEGEETNAIDGENRWCSEDDDDSEYTSDNDDEIQSDNDSEEGTTSKTTAATALQFKIAGIDLNEFLADVDTNIQEVYTITPGQLKSSRSTQISCAELPDKPYIELDLRKVLRRVWGFSEFRADQAAVIKRILEGKSVLLIQSTGSGKSLTYQIPALIESSLFNGLTVVVTPLISLMHDQIKNLPKGVNGAVISHGSHEKVVSQITKGQIHLLYVSPERLVSPRFQDLMMSDEVPEIKLAVIDEAHCVSEWSHNFRSAYFQIPKALKQIGASRVLAMTGTATQTLTEGLCKMFAVDPESGVIRGSVVRENISLRVIKVDSGSASSKGREEELIRLLRTPEFASLDSVLIYVATQATADRIAEYLTVRSIPAQSYHAGKPAEERNRIQMGFVHNSSEKRKGFDVAIRVLVATVAFGMGIDKRDLRAVVHFNLPRNMEAYVQEIGRVGRDGNSAYGVLLLDTKIAGPSNVSNCCSSDAIRICSWAHADEVDVAATRRLLQQHLFPPEFVKSAILRAAQVCVGGDFEDSALWVVSNIAVMGLKELETDIDVGQPVVRTLINYLALNNPQMFCIESDAHRTCTIRFVRTEIGKLAESYEIFERILEIVRGTSKVYGTRKGTAVDVDMFDLAKRLNMSVTEATLEIYKWRAKREIVVEWKNPSCVVKITLDMREFIGNDKSKEDAEWWIDKISANIDMRISQLATELADQSQRVISESVEKARVIERVMLTASDKEAQNDFVQDAIRAYFAPTQEAAGLQSEDVQEVICGKRPTEMEDRAETKERIRSAISKFVERNMAEFTTGRAVARVFHGLSSPNYPSSQWMWCPEWNSLVEVDFEAVRECAQEELVKVRCQTRGL